MLRMPVARDGSFTFTIEGNDLAKGLRPSANAARDNKFLTECQGVIGRDGMSLASIPSFMWGPILVSLLSAGTVSFPFPQVILTKQFVLVLTHNKIWEASSGAGAGALTLVYNSNASIIQENTLWSVLDFDNYLFLTNGYRTVLRDPVSGKYYKVSDRPIAVCACDFNGQIFLGSPTAPDGKGQPEEDDHYHYNPPM